MSSEPLSSIPLQKFIYFDSFFSVIYLGMELLIFAYKGYALYYPANSIGIEIFYLFILAACQYSRLLVGDMGNKTEQGSLILWFFLLSFPCVCFNIYFLVIQTYVIILELILNIMALFYVMAELLFSLFAYLRFP